MNSSNRTQIESVLQECLKYFALKNCPDEWELTDDVIGRCGLDSADGVELACELDSRFGISIPPKDNPLVLDDDGTGRRRSRNYGEVLDYLEAFALKSPEDRHE